MIRNPIHRAARTKWKTDVRKLKKILIVDDDASIRMLIKCTLQDPEREFVEATNPLDGLYLAKEGLPDLILLDLGMPGFFSGFSLFDGVRKLSTSKHIRIVIVSGWTEKEDVEHARRLGADAYIMKPFSPHKLLEIVEQMEAESDQMPVILPDGDTHKKPKSIRPKTTVVRRCW